MGFFDTFIELNNSDPESLIPDLKKADFRQFILEEKGRTYETVCLLSLGVTHLVQKPQQLLYDDPEYYIAIDTYTYTYYVCFRQLLMIDCDFSKITNCTVSTEQKVRKYCSDHPECLFRVFKTRNGLHLFLINQKMDYKSREAISMMLELDCDFYYSVFAYLRGWSVRLNRKSSETSQYIYEELESIGTGEKDQLLDKLVTLHINLMKVFQNERSNLLF